MSYHLKHLSGFTFDFFVQKESEPIAMATINYIYLRKKSYKAYIFKIINNKYTKRQQHYVVHSLTLQ